MNKKVVLVGCGQLGSRHLQAIVKLGDRIKIQVVEPNLANQNVGKMRLSEIQKENNDPDVTWFRDIEDIDNESDLAIVATTSRGRAEIITKLAEKGHKRFLVEKMVCQSKEEYEDLLEIFETRHAKAWVDCTRRYFPFYERIFPLLENEKTLIFNVIGGNYGLGSNAIHLLDLYWWLGGLSRNLKLNGDYLIPTLLPNRRGSDLIEFAGTIIASTPEGCFASFTFHPENDAPVLINMASDNYQIFVNEGSEKALIASKENNWHWQAHAFETIYSSNLTNKIAFSIFETDSCNLPSLQESFLLHDELFRIFNQHIKRITGKNEVLCPIT